MEVQDGRVSRLHCILHPDKATSPKAGGSTVAGGESQQMHRGHDTLRDAGWSYVLDVKQAG